MPHGPASKPAESAASETAEGAVPGGTGADAGTAEGAVPGRTGSDAGTGEGAVPGRTGADAGTAEVVAPGGAARAGSEPGESADFGTRGAVV